MSHGKDTEVDKDHADTAGDASEIFTPFPDYKARDNGSTAKREGDVPVTANGHPQTCAETKDISASEVALDNVTVKYGKRTVLDGLSFRIRRGQGTAIIGPSGTG